MPEQGPVTQTVNASDARRQWNNLLTQVHRKETRVIVEESGIPVAAVISTDDLARLDRYDRERAERFKVLDEIGAAFRGVPSEEIEQEVGLALAEARAEARRDMTQAASKP